MRRALLVSLLVGCGEITPLTDTWSPPTDTAETSTTSTSSTEPPTGTTGGTTGTTSGGMPLDDFLDAFVEAYCAAWDACNTSGSPCPVYAATDVSGCDYDPIAGQQCVEGEYGCDTQFGPGLELVVQPAACDAVCG